MLATVTVERNTRALFYDETKTVCQCMLYAELCLPAKFNESIGATNKGWMMLGVCLKVGLTLPELQAGPVCDAVKLNNELPVTQSVSQPATSFMTQICRKNVAAVDFFSHQLRTTGEVCQSHQATALYRGRGGRGGGGRLV